MDPLEQREIGTTGVNVTRLGLGGSSLGGMYKASSDGEAADVIQALYDMKLNYIDTAPSYGFGLSEERIGNALESIPRDEYVISTKVGELVVNDGSARKVDLFKGVGDRSKVWDFSRDGVFRSVESSLERLKIDAIDILLIHDPYHGRIDEAIDKAYPAVDELRSEGAVKAIGVGTGGTDLLIRFARECDVDCFLSFGSYSLIKNDALDELFPLCQEKGITILLGAPFDSGILASDLKGDFRYRYHEAPPTVIDHVRRVNDVCASHGVPLKAAALQYVLRHPTVATTITGTRSAARLKENFEMIEHPIPESLWSDLEAEGLTREYGSPQLDEV